MSRISSQGLVAPWPNPTTVLYFFTGLPNGPIQRIYMDKYPFEKYPFDIPACRTDLSSGQNPFKKYPFGKYPFEKYPFDIPAYRTDLSSGQNPFKKYTFQKYTFQNYTFDILAYLYNGNIGYLHLLNMRLTFHAIAGASRPLHEPHYRFILFFTGMPGTAVPWPNPATVLCRPTERTYPTDLPNGSIPVCKQIRLESSLFGNRSV